MFNTLWSRNDAQGNHDAHEDGGPVSSRPSSTGSGSLLDLPAKHEKGAKLLRSRSQNLAERLRELTVTRKDNMPARDRSELKQCMNELLNGLDWKLLGRRMDGFALNSSGRFLLKTSPARNLRIAIESTDHSQSSLHRSQTPTQSSGSVSDRGDHSEIQSQLSAHSSTGDQSLPSRDGIGSAPTSLPQVDLEFAIVMGPNHIKYRNIELYLFNDLLLLVKSSSKKFYALSAPLYLRSLVVTECEPGIYQHHLKFKLLFGDYKYYIKVDSSAVRDEWISHIQGALEWLDTVDGYAWTLSAPDSRNIVMRVSDVPFPRTRTSVDVLNNTPKNRNHIISDSVFEIVVEDVDPSAVETGTVATENALLPASAKSGVSRSTSLPVLGVHHPRATQEPPPLAPVTPPGSPGTRARSPAPSPPNSPLLTIPEPQTPTRRRTQKMENERKNTENEQTIPKARKSSLKDVMEKDALAREKSTAAITPASLEQGVNTVQKPAQNDEISLQPSQKPTEAGEISSQTPQDHESSTSSELDRLYDAQIAANGVIEPPRSPISECQVGGLEMKKAPTVGSLDSEISQINQIRKEGSVGFEDENVNVNNKGGEEEDVGGVRSPGALSNVSGSDLARSASSVLVIGAPSRTHSVLRQRSTSSGRREVERGGEEGEGEGISETEEGVRIEDRYQNVMYLNCEGKDVMIFDGSLTSEGIQNIILAGTVEKLVEHLADENPMENEYIRAFLLTHTHIIDAMELLNMLIGRFNSLPRSTSKEDQAFFAKWKKPIQTKVIKVLVTWVVDYWEDFEGNSALVEKLERFVPDVDASGFLISSKMLSEAIRRSRKQYRERRADGEEFKFTPAQSRTDDQTFASTDAADLAQQITLFDWQVYERIHIKQFLYHIWPPKGKKTKEHSPELQAFIDRFNIESNWVATEVCLAGEAKEQARAISKFIDVIRICVQQLHNYYSSFAMIGGLRYPSVRALKSAWELVPPKSVETLRGFESTLMNPSRNMKCYRDTIAELKDVPVIPFLPLSLKDLVFINDGNDKIIANTDMYNFDKLRMIARICFTLQSYKSVPYAKITAKAKIQRYLRTCFVCPDIESHMLTNSANKSLSALRPRSPTT